MSQEAEILNLLYRGERDAFEARLQQFRRIQLSQSKLGKGKLCRLINRVVKLDGQYATVLIEDVSNMLNDSDRVVRNEALAAFARSGHSFMFNILLACACYPGNEVANDAFADLQCALNLVQHAITAMDSHDLKEQNTPMGFPSLIHNISNVPLVNAFKIVMMQLALSAQLGVEPSKSRKQQPLKANGDDECSNHVKSKDKGSEGVNEEKRIHKEAIFTDDKWRHIITSNKYVMNHLSIWSYDAVRLLASCICASAKPKNKFITKRGLLAAEVACTLITYYPHQYFDMLAKPLIATYTHIHNKVSDYETFILRVFTSDEAREYHVGFADMLNEAGYKCSLSEIYKRAHSKATGNKCYVYGGEGDVKLDDAVNIVSMLSGINEDNELFHLATQKYGERLPDETLNEINAAQIFEYDPEVIQHMNKGEEIFDCTTSELRLSHTKAMEEKHKITLEDKFNPDYLHQSAVVEVKPTSCKAIREHHQLYSQLVATQMMDTVVSYTWHLQRSVVSGNHRNRFTWCNRVLFNKLFTSGLMTKDTQLALFSELMDHLAQMALIDVVSLSIKKDTLNNVILTDATNPLLSALADAKNVGVSELLAHVASQRRATALESLLDYINELLMNKASIELARAVVAGRKECCVKELIGCIDAGEDSLGKSRKATEGSRATYGELVEIVLEKLYKSRILEIVEIRDTYVLQICRFILHMPFIPLTIVNQINNWMSDQISRRLAFSLISNILKKSQCPLLKEQTLIMFLRTLISEDPEIRTLFQRLVSSPKGIYHINVDGRRYSKAKHESVHNAMIEWIRGGCGCSKCKIEPSLKEEYIQDCNSMATRPLWQWPSGLIKAIDDSSASEGKKKKHCEGCGWKNFKSTLLNSDNKKCNDAVEWIYMPSLWLEEIFALMAKPGSLNAHPFICQIAQCVRKDAVTECLPEPLIVAAGKNGYMVPFICDLTDSFDDHMVKQAMRTCSAHVTEIVYVLKYKPEEDKFLVGLLQELRAMWLDPKYQLLELWSKAPSPAKQLVDVALQHLISCDAYAMQLVPFMTVEQMEKVIMHLFTHGTEESLKQIFSLLLEVPTSFRREQKELNFALPQHFMYQCYSIKPNKELLRKQTGILDHCVECCVRGQMSVEAALSACTLIVESTDEVSFVFGRVICQLVQRVTQTRSVVVQSILPALFQRGAWSDKMLWRGVVICMTTLWVGHKEQLCKLLLQLPQEQGEATIKTLQTQHNVIAFMESTLPQLDHTVHIPDYIKVMLSM
ncbi:hypothetical protein BgAZ_301260 [Babesia gibsoni]|uniref:Symplekin C-terminal domain-containing protein n=1 Tax=Babesia gibsoni TaxID=33632 RepID=A0AAD8PCW2_BABGI|nr:hypothetical protein BgAZ_301260 [Babesia gibsoni]